MTRPNEEARWTALPAAILLSAAAHAQTNPGIVAASAEPGDQLSEVVVHANRREENLQSVPVAAASISGDQALQLGIVDPQALGQSVPGLVFDMQTNSLTPFIRGVGNSNADPGNEPSVATYVDDVYIPFAAATIAQYIDLDRLEVLKGPQGTLFGRNATGGVVQIFTKNPDSTPELRLRAGYGNYATTSGAVYGNLPLTDTLAANISGHFSKQNDGWGHYEVSGAPTFADEKSYGGRMKVQWTPNDRTKILLSLDDDVINGSDGIIYNVRPGTVSSSLSLLGLPVPGASTSAPPNFWDNGGNFPAHSHSEQRGASIKVSYDFDAATLLSISAIRDNHYHMQYDFDMGPQPIFNAHLAGLGETLTQELRLQSRAGAALNWVAGVFYYHDQSGYVPIQADALASPFAALNGGDPLIGNFVSNFSHQKTDSGAVFAQGSYEVLPKLNLTLGLRYTGDWRSADNYNTSSLQAAVTPGNSVVPQCPTNGPTFLGVATCFGGKNDANFESPSGKLALDYRLTDDLMAYIAYNRGFKSGLFNAVSILTPLDPPVRPETLDAFSIGEKAEFLDHRLRVNAEAYWYKYKNMQVDVIVNNGSHNVNAAASDIKGLDLDVTAIPFHGLTLSGSIALEDAKFKDYPEGTYSVYNSATGGNCSLTPANNCGLTPGDPRAPPNYDGTTWNLKDNRVPRAPPFTFSVKAQYEHLLPIGTLDYNVSLNRIGDYFFDVDNGKGQLNPDSDRQPKSYILDGSIGWRSVRDDWEVRAWGANLLQEKYYAWSLEIGNASTYSPSPPRTYGITFTKVFGGPAR